MADNDVFKPAAILLKHSQVQTNEAPSAGYDAVLPEQTAASDTGAPAGPHAAAQPLLESRLSRLIDLQGSDPGFYILAVHSFVESFLREHFELVSDSETFADLLYYYKQELLAERRGFIPLIGILSEFAHNQRLANNVRHRFLRLDPEEAAAATFRIIRFCEEAGLHCERAMATLRKSLELWNDRSNRWEEMQELKKAHFDVLKERRENERLAAQLEELKRVSRDFEAAQKEKLDIELKLEELKALKDERGEKIDELRKRRFEVEEEKRRLAARVLELEQSNSYLLNLTRLSSYARSRLDYERAVTRLSKEQERIIDEINFGSDFLIRGNAGTGKTLVLIKALEKARKMQADELTFDEAAGSTILLTYTRTLVKYDRYLAEIMQTGEAESSIQTVDKYLRDALVSLDPGADVDYGLVEQFIKAKGAAHAVKMLSPRELIEEIEDYLFANMVGEQEYLIDLMPRSGMGKPLTKTHREQVFALSRELIDHMEKTRRYSKNYSRIRLLDLLGKGPESSELGYDFVFIDEVQDLTAADLAALKQLAGRTVIMAGDADQSIYQPGFTFARAGIDISGRSRILRLNFRNTVQIHNAAETFRQKGGVLATDQEHVPEAFRSGPPPECFAAGDDEALLGKLTAQASLFIDTLGYSPENVCAVAPTGTWIERIAGALAKNGYESADLREPEFSFHRRDVIKLSTLHSSKGLDFPVVLLFLPEMPYAGTRFDTRSKDRITRNLIYVAMTRAMDHLNVFVLADATDQALADARLCLSPTPELRHG